jgi:response regulator of citrate/malate metabolism
MKLFRADVTEDCEEISVILVAKNIKSAKKIVRNMDWSCFMGVDIYELDQVDGYRILLEKVESECK